MGQKMLTDANRKLVFVPSLVNFRKPTATELNGGMELSCMVTAANYNLGATGDDSITDPALCSSSNSSTPGRTNYEAGMDMFRWKDKADDLPWDTFRAKGLHGYLVQRIGQLDDGERAQDVDFRDTDEVQVYEVLTNTPKILSPSGAGYEKFRQDFSVQDNVDERAVVGGTAPVGG